MSSETTDTDHFQVRENEFVKSSHCEAFLPLEDVVKCYEQAGEWKGQRHTANAKSMG